MGRLSDSVVLASSANRTTSGQGTAIDLSGYRSGIIYCHLTTLTGGTTPSVQAFLQVSWDGSTWAGDKDSSPVAASALSATGLAFKVFSGMIGGLVRPAWTITGSPTNATFAIYGTFEKIR